jgi:hypothetical protein
MQCVLMARPGNSEPGTATFESAHTFDEFEAA